jgi:hypothetical protein
MAEILELIQSMENPGEEQLVVQIEGDLQPQQLLGIVPFPFILSQIVLAMAQSVAG